MLEGRPSGLPLQRRVVLPNQRSAASQDGAENVCRGPPSQSAFRLLPHAGGPEGRQEDPRPEAVCVTFCVDLGRRGSTCTTTGPSLPVLSQVRGLETSP